MPSELLPMKCSWRFIVLEAKDFCDEQHIVRTARREMVSMVMEHVFWPSGVTALYVGFGAKIPLTSPGLFNLNVIEKEAMRENKRIITLALRPS
jgi:hypothetical protein